MAGIGRWWSVKIKLSGYHLIDLNCYGGLNMLGPWEVALLGGVALLEEVCH